MEEQIKRFVDVLDFEVTNLESRREELRRQIVGCVQETRYVSDCRFTASLITDLAEVFSRLDQLAVTRKHTLRTFGESVLGTEEGA